jgi:hypothetical protein
MEELLAVSASQIELEAIGGVGKFFELRLGIGILIRDMRRLLRHTDRGRGLDARCHVLDRRGRHSRPPCRPVPTSSLANAAMRPASTRQSPVPGVGAANVDYITHRPSDCNRDVTTSTVALKRRCALHNLDHVPSLAMPVGT